jgi:hypothetical protein
MDSETYRAPQEPETALMSRWERLRGGVRTKVRRRACCPWPGPTPNETFAEAAMSS